MSTSEPIAKTASVTGARTRAGDPGRPATYCGIPLGDDRRGSLRSGRTCSRPTALTYLADQDLCVELPPSRLLGMFDPVLHGWHDRSFVLGQYPLRILVR